MTPAEQAGRWVRLSLALTAGLTAIVSSVALYAGGAAWATGVWIGAVLAIACHVATARAVAQVLHVSTEPPRPSTGEAGDVAHCASGEVGSPLLDAAERGLAVARIRRKSMILLGFVALALLGVLWYEPARPEGVALGAGLALVALVSAAVALERSRR